MYKIKWCTKCQPTLIGVGRVVYYECRCGLPMTKTLQSSHSTCIMLLHCTCRHLFKHFVLKLHSLPLHYTTIRQYVVFNLRLRCYFLFFFSLSFHVFHSKNFKIYIRYAYTNIHIQHGWKKKKKKIA